jgi:hypothetical protein
MASACKELLQHGSHRRDEVVRQAFERAVPTVRQTFRIARTAKAAGAAGLLVGLFVPVIGVLAAIGLVLYFAGAVVTVVRARWYSHIPYPLVFLAPVAASMALRFAA